MPNKISEEFFPIAFDSPKDGGRTEMGLIEAGISAMHGGLSMAPQDEYEKPSGCPAGYMEVDGMCVRIN